MAEDIPKPFLEHLEDLRWVLLKSLTSLLIFMILACVFHQQILAILQLPLERAIEARGAKVSDYLIMLNVTDPLTITIKTGFFAGMVLALPLIFYFIGDFVLPALHVHEKKLLIPTFMSGGLLFLGGCVFCYYLVLPVALPFFMDWGEALNTKAQIPLSFYITFVLQVMTAFGLSFELPLVMIILANLGIVNKKMLTQYRRHAILALLVFSACITPADPVTLALLFFPLYGLYEVSVFIVGFIDKKHLKKEKKFWHG
ncbi:MAG: twin-arginine translocase subunit TatC [Verrucomicrobiota bacterium]